MSSQTPRDPRPDHEARAGVDSALEWRSRLSIAVAGLLLFETLSGISIWLLPFSVSNQFAVLLHTAAGAAFLVPFLVYQARHWWIYRGRAWSPYTLTGYVAGAAVLLNVISGVVLTVQAMVALRITPVWDTVHIVTTVAIVCFAIPHVLLLHLRNRKSQSRDLLPSVAAARRWTVGVGVWTAAGFACLALGVATYQPVVWNNSFPPDYHSDAEHGPFSPSLATTASGGAYDDRSLTGSAACGTAGCHQAIYDEWAISSHRWSSMDPAFQKIQEVMAKQNGPESTRYCGGCHDPVSLFSGTKNTFTDQLSSLRGYQEGVSCLICHSIRETDLKGNANYVIQQPQRYIYEVREGRLAKGVSDFLIRAYPRRHVEVYSKRLFKTPEYCAACHKQFIDQEVNQVGWVQLQNQYDNWRKSRWNPEGEPEKVVECRECHMPLQESDDPGAGDDLDPYRRPDDGMHRDHRFIAANSYIPGLLELPGWQEHRALTEAWLQGKRPIPEIAFKWASGPAVSIAIQCPDTVRAGERVDVRVVITSNKVGHDFPTGPLDIIQSWIEFEATDAAGEVIFASGTVDDEHFIKPGSFIFKAEPVDRYGNLIDRHNLWEMVGVRFRRSLFPGFSDVATFDFQCPAGLEEVTAGSSATAAAADAAAERGFRLEAPAASGSIRLKASLDYRKFDQYLLNFVFGEDSNLTAPIVRMSSDVRTIWVEES